MRKLLLVPVLALTGVIGAHGPAFAAAPSQAGCSGQYASAYGGPQFGLFVSSSARDLHGAGMSLGRDAIGPASSTNACANYYPYPPYP